MPTSLYSELSLELTHFQLEYLRRIVQAQLAKTQAIVDAEGPIDHPLTDWLLIESSLLDRINEARLHSVYTDDQGDWLL